MNHNVTDAGAGGRAPARSRTSGIGRLTGSDATRRAMRSATWTAWREPAHATFISSTSKRAVALSAARWSTSAMALRCWLPRLCNLQLQCNNSSLKTSQLTCSASRGPSLWWRWRTYRAGGGAESGSATRRISFYMCVYLTHHATCVRVPPRDGQTDRPPGLAWARWSLAKNQDGPAELAGLIFCLSPVRSGSNRVRPARLVKKTGRKAG
jgi:hypothetical protein